VAENLKKGERRMKGIQKIKLALALAAVLAMSGTGWAKPNGPGLPGDLNGSRDTVEVLLTVGACTAVLNHTYSIKAYIYQPSGRMFAVGIGNNPFTCQAVAQEVLLTVNAVQGITFKPGPATLIYQILDTDNTNPSTPPVTTVVDEQGFRVDLH
jgi:hypothetical protein